LVYVLTSTTSSSSDNASAALGGANGPAGLLLVARRLMTTSWHAFRYLALGVGRSRHRHGYQRSHHHQRHLTNNHNAPHLDTTSFSRIPRVMGCSSSLSRRMMAHPLGKHIVITTYLSALGGTYFLPLFIWVPRRGFSEARCARLTPELSLPGNGRAGPPHPRHCPTKPS
jgi:hypothetical protein